MTWTSPVPDAITAARDMIVACASAATASLTSGTFHYPTIAMSGASADSRPCVIMDQIHTARDRYAEQGVLGNPSGTIVATIYMDNATVPTMESLAEDICSELMSQATGLPLRSAVPSRASDPTPGQRAADATTADNTSFFRCISVTIEWGLSP